MQDLKVEIKGLSEEEVKQRINEGKQNVSSTVKTKSVKQILKDNICTMFNLINVILFVLLLLVGSYKNMLFIGVVVFNTIIGIVQELRSKQSVDKLTILTESKRRQTGAAIQGRPRTRRRHTAFARQPDTRRLRSHRRSLSGEREPVDG